MKKQRLPLNLGLATLFATSLVGAMSVRVNAGSSPVPGVAPDSSGVTGGIFNPEPPAAPAAPAAGTGATVDTGGQVSVPAVVQTSVNNAAVTVISTPAPAGSPAATIIVLIAGGSGSSGAAANVTTTIVSLGVSPASVQVLVNALGALLGGSSSASATPGILVASAGGAADINLAQNGAKPNVDINQLNTAINAYNQIIMESDAEALRKLSTNAEFVEMGKVLRELRAAMTQG